MHRFRLKRSRILCALGVLVTLYLLDSLFSPDCRKIFRYDAKRKWSVSNNVLHAPLQPASSITMVTSMMPEELPYFVSMMKTWKGPVSLAVYVSDSEQSNGFLKSWERHPELKSRHDINLNFVIKDGEYYPRNLLNNVALENAHTDYVFLTEVGEVPCPNIHARLRQYISGRPGLIRTRKWDQGLVIPVFQGPGSVPQNKSEVLEKLKLGHLQPYQPTLLYNSYKMTNYEVWVMASSPYLVYYVKGYSPNLVLNRTIAPAFNTKIVGRDFDRLSFHGELYVAGLRMSVLPDLYSLRTYDQVMYPEPMLEMFNKTPDIRCIANEFMSFRQQLEKRYCPETVVKPGKIHINQKLYCRRIQFWDMVDQIYKKAYG